MRKTVSAEERAAVVKWDEPPRSLPLFGELSGVMVVEPICGCGLCPPLVMLAINVEMSIALAVMEELAK